MVIVRSTIVRVRLPDPPFKTNEETTKCLMPILQKHSRSLTSQKLTGQDAIFLTVLVKDARRFNSRLEAANRRIVRLVEGLRAIRADWSGTKAWEHATGVLAAEEAKFRDEING